MSHKVARPNINGWVDKIIDVAEKKPRVELPLLVARNIMSFGCDWE